MATVDDFVGRDCPYCHAVDSLETDEARGEVACTNCAKVIAMGLEESVNTRYNENATYDDVDRHALGPDDEYPGGKTDAGAVSNSTNAMSRSRAAALAAGLVRPHRATGSGEEAGSAEERRQRYARTQLHPRMQQYIENLARLARRGETVQQRALELARQYVGRRRERRERVEQQSEVGAVCVMLASEMAGLPLPLAELHVLDPSLKKMPELRSQVVNYLEMQDEERRLHRSFAGNLLRYYIRLLQLQMIRYERASTVLLQVLQDLSRVEHEWGKLVDAERIALAVLLARTAPALHWKDKPHYDPDAEPPAKTLYASFAASAHLNEARVLKVMQLAEHSLPLICRRFDAAMQKLEASAKAEECVEEHDEAGEGTEGDDKSRTATATVKTERTAGVKRERSQS